MRGCYRCGAEISRESVGVRDVCDRCQAYLHCCRNCEFYEKGAHNDCREPNAELVSEKENGNFCDFFRFRMGAQDADGRKPDDARARLDALFRKR
jgi:hypothetical protein